MTGICVQVIYAKNLNSVKMCDNNAFLLIQMDSDELFIKYHRYTECYNLSVIFTRF